MSLIGQLQYLLHTRPELSYYVNKLKRHTTKTRIIHWQAAQHVLAYVNGTLDMRLVFCNNGDQAVTLTPQFFSDADYAQNAETRKSITGVTVNLAGASILARSIQQPTVADSTLAAEVIALHSIVKDAIWVRHMLEWMGFLQHQPSIIWCDNRGAVFNCEDGGLRSKTKHLDIKYMFIREMVRQNLIKIKHIPTDQMIADILTKHLGWIKFTKYASALGLMKGSVLETSDVINHAEERS